MNTQLTTISLRRLQVFLAVCETLHMARAAEALGVAQPALSQQIRSLEAALGLRLFHRRKRGIDLTAAGTACRAEAIRLLGQHARLIENVRRVARGEAGRLVVGYVGSAMFERRFPAQLRRMAERFPGVDLSLREGSITSLLAALAAGEVDVALVRAPARIDPPLRHRFHSRQDLVVILPQGHRLAMLDAIPITELAREPMVGFPDPEDVGIMRVVAERAAAEGVALQVKWQVAEIGSALGLVAAGLGFGIVPQEIAALAGPEIAQRALDGRPAPHAELWLVWHGEKTAPALERFLALLAAEQD